MSKNVVIISSTPRKNGNSEVLAQEFARGAREAGNTISLLTLRTMRYGFCRGCMYCQSREGCTVKDGIDDSVLSLVQNADVLVFATPVYYYAVSGQLKTFLDRMNPLFPRENRFRDVYLLASAAEDDESAMDGAVKDVQGWVDCFENARFAGVIRGIGADAIGEIQKTDAPQRAYEMGKQA